ncbi:hypothetical protein EVAR_76685_1 [Eumeta japonica]|uniref:Uncharacterized protein n=1 Tax=Eumeta variegata TaxID=151549 RepID=A0A4C1SSV0_EUMVA|nr:hypothetical protein EVAR_76685_1 [Eumeta japonica]
MISHETRKKFSLATFRRDQGIAANVYGVEILMEHCLIAPASPLGNRTSPNSLARRLLIKFLQRCELSSRQFQPSRAPPARPTAVTLLSRTMDLTIG